MILRPTPVSSKQFTFVAEENLLVAEASSLPDLGRVYDDACDDGLTVLHENNREVVYAVNHIERNTDDLLYWDLIPVKAFGSLIGLPRVRIFND